jgi:4-amino-4-deoxychorismate lyase
MIALINGVSGSSVSVKDRGLLYGDGAFETIALRNRQLVLLKPHLERLKKACTLLRLPFAQATIEADLKVLLQAAANDGICKIIITRGESGRGYRAEPEAAATRIVQFFEAPPQQELHKGITAGLSTHRLGESAQFSGLKHLNRLDQVMASFDLAPHMFEVVCLDQRGWVIEGSRSNIIAVIDGKLVTPKLGSSGVQGIMLDELVAKFSAIGKPVEFVQLSLDALCNASEILFCNSVFGVCPVIQLQENARVHEWGIGDICRQAIAFQHELFGTSI